MAWKATDGKANAGVVTFHRLSDDRSRIMVQIEHESEGVMEKVGSALGADTREVKNSLERFKELVGAPAEPGDGRLARLRSKAAGARADQQSRGGV